MGETTVVDTAALMAAALAASARGHDVLTAEATSGPPLLRVAAELPGARSAHQATAVRQAVGSVLGELGQALEGWCRLLQAAGGHYAQAEQRAASASGVAGPR
jgi:type IV secretory pathway TrbL component